MTKYTISHIPWTRFAVLWLVWTFLTICPTFVAHSAETPDSITPTTVGDYPDVPLHPSIEYPEMAITDTLRTPGKTYAENYWWYQLRKFHRVDTHDERVNYPRFLGFCMKIYRWADHAFNDHDPKYVKGDGRNWKVFLLSDNWTDAYTFRPRRTPPIYMMSNVYSNLGINVKYMAVSVGYSLDMNAIVSGQKSNHYKWDFGFSCARFNIEFHYWKNDGGTYIRRFGDYNNRHLIRKHFDGLTFKGLQGLGFYIFNSRKFSLGAAQSNSNNQCRSAGSAMVGLDISSYDVNFDFTALPIELKIFYDYPFDNYRFHYQSYKIIGGYSYNWVLNKHFVANLTALPGIGIASSDYDSTYGSKVLLSLGGKGIAALSYCNKRFFAGITASLTINTFISHKIGFASVIQNYQGAVGIKF